jgi:SRSO17 transposase
MERRYEARLVEMLSQAQVSPELVDGLLTRLDEFVAPFAAALSEPEQQRHAAGYVTGLLSKLEHKTSEGIAYLHDQERQGIQKFIGNVPWDQQPLLTTLARQVGQDLGEPDGVIVFDPSGFPKKGTKSVGVARQWCSRLGKIENCQVGLYMAYASRKEHAIVNMRLYLPEESTKDRARRKDAGVPKSIKFRTRHELALEMLDEQGPLLPHAWVTGDDEMGRPASFRQGLRDRSKQYLLGIPSSSCWASHRTRRFVTATRPRRNIRDTDDGRRAPSCASSAGVRHCRKARGRSWMCVMARKGRWWSKPSRVESNPGHQREVLGPVSCFSSRANVRRTAR